MHGMTKLDGALLALGVAVMDAWEALPDGQRALAIPKILGEPSKDDLVGRIIAEIRTLERGQLIGDDT
jgi:hypothetical protein